VPPERGLFHERNWEIVVKGLVSEKAKRKPIQAAEILGTIAQKDVPNNLQCAMIKSLRRWFAKLDSPL
jgi:hypothetical protein